MEDTPRTDKQTVVLAYLASPYCSGPDEVTRILDWHATQERAGVAISTLIDTYGDGVADSRIACAAELIDRIDWEDEPPDPAGMPVEDLDELIADLILIITREERRTS